MGVLKYVIFVLWVVARRAGAKRISMGTREFERKIIIEPQLVCFLPIEPSILLTY